MPPQPRRNPLFFLLGIALVVSLEHAACSADVPGDEEMNRRLSRPLVSVFEGRPFRAVLEQIADNAELNLWLDRHVDPTAPIDVGQVGPTVFAALEAVAESRDCVVYPLRNVVLVGREAWVDRTAASLLRLPLEQGPDLASQQVSWPKLTTPSQALAIAAGSDAGPGDAQYRLHRLPHDLWPAVKWENLERSVAMTLVLAQLDRRLHESHHNAIESGQFQLLAPTELKTIPADRRGRYRWTYKSFPDSARAVRSLRREDPHVQVSRAGPELSIRGTAAAHRAFTRQSLISAAESDKPTAAPSGDKRFTLRLKNKPADEVLAQLAGAAGKKITIRREAESACERLVSLEAKDATLSELAEAVANQAGVAVSWGNEVTVSAQ